MRTDDDLDMVATCDPLTPGVLESADRTARSQELLRMILAEPRPLTADRRKGRENRPSASRRTVLVAAGLTAAAVTAALAVSVSEGTGQGGYIKTPPLLQYQLAANGQVPRLDALPAARTVLLKLAAAASHRADGAEPGDVAYTKTRDWHMNLSVEDRQSSVEMSEEINQRLWAADGTRRFVRQRHGQVRAEDTTFPGPRPQWLDPRLTASQLEGRLLAEPRSQDETPSYHLLGAITQVGLNEVIGPRSAATMWRMLAARTDIRSLGQVQDRAGRTGQAITTDCDYAGRWSQRRVLIIDPVSGNLLASEEIYLTKPKRLVINTPAVNQYHNYLEQRWVANINALP